MCRVFPARHQEKKRRNIQSVCRARKGSPFLHGDGLEITRVLKRRRQQRLPFTTRPGHSANHDSPPTLDPRSPTSVPTTSTSNSRQYRNSQFCSRKPDSRTVPFTTKLVRDRFQVLNLVRTDSVAPQTSVFAMHIFAGLSFTRERTKSLCTIGYRCRYWVQGHPWTRPAILTKM
jgi:hypothetical protein